MKPLPVTLASVMTVGALEIAARYWNRRLLSKWELVMTPAGSRFRFRSSSIAFCPRRSRALVDGRAVTKPGPDRALSITQGAATRNGTSNEGEKNVRFEARERHLVTDEKRGGSFGVSILTRGSLSVTAISSSPVGGRIRALDVL